MGLLLPLMLLLGPVGLSAAGAEEGPTGPSGTSDGSDEEVTTTSTSTVTTDADIDDVDIDDESDAETSEDPTAEAGSDEGVDQTTDAEGEVVGTMTGSIAGTMAGSIAVDAAVCAGTKVDFGSLPTTIDGVAITVVDSATLHFDIPDGTTVEVCVKAGSTEAGEGPENLTLTADADVSHSSGKELSHVSVISVTTATTTTGTTTTQTTTTPVGTGRIVIEKDTDPEDVSTEFSFTGAISASLQDDESAGVDVQAGTHVVSEVALEGWTLEAIVCNDSDSSGSGNTATFVVDPGETVKCFFENAQAGTATTTTETGTTTTTPGGTTTATTETGTTTTGTTSTASPSVLGGNVTPGGGGGANVGGETVSPSGSLAFTGLPAIAIAGAAALLLLTGTGLLRLAARRDRS